MNLTPESDELADELTSLVERHGPLAAGAFAHCVAQSHPYLAIECIELTNDIFRNRKPKKRQGWLEKLFT